MADNYQPSSHDAALVKQFNTVRHSNVRHYLTQSNSPFIFADISKLDNASEHLVVCFER